MSKINSCVLMCAAWRGEAVLMRAAWRGDAVLMRAAWRGWSQVGVGLGGELAED